MPPTAAQQAEHACKCLNVRLTQAESKSPPPDTPTDPAYTAIHVGEEGIHVAHPQLTVRVKSRGTVIPGTSRCSRFTTLSCLICDLSVYRVHQVISVEVEGNDLPLLPSDSWAEQEIMKSPNGWVEINGDCLCGAQISQAESSPEYSPIYGVVLPPALPTASENPKPHILPESAVSPAPAPSDPISYLKDLPPLFPPPPFTSSHTTFLHLVSAAAKESDSIRATAEKDILAFVKAKEAEIQAQEARLKSSVQRLWEKYRKGLNRIQQQRPHAPSASTRPTSLKHGDHRTSGQAFSAPVTTIRDFVPVSEVAPLPPTRNTKPKISALSVSLANNSHLHEAMNSRTTKTDSASISSQSPTSTLVPTTTKENEVGSVLALPRRLDDSINTAMSYRFFVLEDEMNRKHSQASRNEDVTMGTVGPSQPPQADGASESSKERKKKQSDESKESKSKHDKHVHFKVQPGLKEASEKSQKADEGDANGMIFDMEDGNGNVSDSQIPHILPLLEQPSIPHRSRRSKPPPMAGLPASFQALRPASLPAPSHVRPAHRIPSSDTARNIKLSLPRPAGPEVATNTSQDSKEDTDQDTSEDTTDSSPRQTSESDSEDSEDTSAYDQYHAHNRYGIPGSLPINIVSLTQPREVLSLASYQPKTSASERQPVPPVVQSKKISPASYRRAAYAERDRARAVDPGALDFVPEEDEDDGNEVDRKAHSVESGERAREHALKILQARAEIPEEGMWRSLAS